MVSSMSSNTSREERKMTQLSLKRVINNIAEAQTSTCVFTPMASSAERYRVGGKKSSFKCFTLYYVAVDPIALKKTNGDR